MKKIGNKSNNKVFWVLIAILIVCFVLIGISFYKHFYAGAGSTKYGDRLEGIEGHPLSETISEDIKKIFSDNTTVGEIKSNVKGKIVYVNIDFKETVTVDVAKETSAKALEAFKAEELAFYDVQFIITQSFDSESEETGFPLFGAKSATSEKVVW